MKAVSFYFKESFIANMYFIIFALIDLGVLCIDDSLLTLKYVLCAVVLLGYIFVVGLMFYKEGETAMKVRRGNDLNREQIIKTGREYPINSTEEYTAWKGFMIGLVTCIPLFICMLIHLLVSPQGPYSNGGGVVAAFLYMVVFSFFRTNSKVAVMQNDYYFTLLAAPLVILTIGIGSIVFSLIYVKTKNIAISYLVHLIWDFVGILPVIFGIATLMF